MMSKKAAWLALSVDWMDSDIFDGANDGVRLGWIILLCHVKANGRGGCAKLRVKTFAKRYGLSVRSVEDMLNRAQKCAAITYENENVTLCNWYTYQQKGARLKTKQNMQNEKSHDLCLTPHPSNNTHHPDRVPPVSPPVGDEISPPPDLQIDVNISEAQAEEVYQLYPRHAGKKNAIRAIKKAARHLVNSGCDEPFAYLLHAVSEYARSQFVQTTPVEFIPHPSSWFNQGRYDDDRSEWNRPYRNLHGNEKVDETLTIDNVWKNQPKPSELICEEISDQKACVS